MTLLQTDVHLRFPYGTFPVDPAFRERYMQEYSEASSYVLPTRLPLHHPLLRRLEGVYPLAYALPPWWQECLDQVETTALKPLLATVTAHEFRAGCLEAPRWKAFRESLSQEERRQWPTSPKIAALVEETRWGAYVRNRGSAETPDHLSLVISTQPLDFLYMSNGRGWQSCQHFRDGSENQQLPGNFYDTDVAVALVLVPGTHVEDEASVLARTTLRVFSSQGQTMVVLGRTYHNDETVAFLLLSRLAALFDTQHLSWGWIEEVNTCFYCQKGALGAELRQRLDQSTWVEGTPCWFPRHWEVPYVDGGYVRWKTYQEHSVNEYSGMQLLASIVPMQPPAALQPASAQPLSTGLFPLSS